MVLSKFLDALLLEDNYALTKDMTAQYAAEYILYLEKFMTNFGITGQITDWPLAAVQTELADRFWLEQLQNSIYADSGRMNLEQWWRKRHISRHFGDLAELPEQRVLQLNLADDLVMAFTELRRITLKRNGLNHHALSINNWFHKDVRKAHAWKESKSSKYRQELSGTWAGLYADWREVFNRYNSAHTSLNELTMTIINVAIRDIEAQDDLKSIFLFPENEGFLTECADLRAKIEPNRLLLDESYPDQIGRILHSLEVDNACYLLEKEIAKDCQRMKVALETANGYDS